MPRNPQPQGADRHLLADEARRAAADLCLAIRRLEACTHEPHWKPALIAGPLRADLTDTYHRLTPLVTDEHGNRPEPCGHCELLPTVRGWVRATQDRCVVHGQNPATSPTEHSSGGDSDA